MNRVLLKQRCKILLFIFIFGLLSGCIYLHILWLLKGSLFRNEWAMLIHQLSGYTLKSLFYSMTLYWPWILGFHLFLCLCGFTKFGKILIEGITFCIGVLLGTFETLLLLCFHLKAGGIIFLKIVIVIIPYILFVGSAAVCGCSMSFLKWTSWEKTDKWKGIQLKKYVISIFTTIFFHLVYIFACSYVNFGKINLQFFLR